MGKVKNKYRPGMLFTINRKVYQITKGEGRLCRYKHVVIGYDPCKTSLSKILYQCDSIGYYLKRIK